MQIGVQTRGTDGGALRRYWAAAARRPDRLARSVKLDATLVDSDEEAAAARAAFAAGRGVAPGGVVARSLLAGTPSRLVLRVSEYAAAGATALRLGFTDFPDTRMLEAFAAEVLPALPA